MRERVRGVERKDSVVDVYTHAHTHRCTQPVRETDSVHCVSLEFSLHLSFTLSFYSHDAAEKEEFHFWSVWRVRAVYQNISPSLVCCEVWFIDVYLPVGRHHKSTF